MRRIAGREIAIMSTGITVRGGPRSRRAVWLSLLLGLAWLWAGAAHGFLPFLLTLAPGLLCLTGGILGVVGLEDARDRQIAALGGALGILCGLPAMLVFGFGLGIGLLGVSAWCFLDAGSAAVAAEAEPEGVPPSISSFPLFAKAATDEALLGGMKALLPLPDAETAHRVAREVGQARELFDARGWLEKPEDYHQEPPSLELPRIREARVLTRHGQLAFEHLSFDSEYEPWAEEPGRERWLSLAANRTAHAWVMRHPGPPRPWLVAIHGYGMGRPALDFGLFDPGLFHHRLGLNLLIPALPLHGPRTQGRRSGDGFLAGDILDTIHAQAQAMWDLRRAIGWISRQGAPKIGAYGVSLGGYTASLLAGVEPSLACVIAGIPVTDFSRLLWHHAPSHAERHLDNAGLGREAAEELFRVISPLEHRPKLPLERRKIFGGVADGLVPSDQVRDLWRHWDEPEIVWYQGSHVSFMLEPRVGRMIRSSLREADVAHE
jgi:hypothetical protein